MSDGIATFVCLGRRTNGMKLDVALIRLTPQEVDEGKLGSMLDVENRAILYSKKCNKYFNPGSVYEVDLQGDAILASTAKFIKLWGNKDQRAEWSALDRASAAIEKGWGRSKIDHLKRSLDPARDAYGTARGAAKAHILAQVVKYITSG